MPPPLALARRDALVERVRCAVEALGGEHPHSPEDLVDLSNAMVHAAADLDGETGQPLAQAMELLVTASTAYQGAIRQALDGIGHARRAGAAYGHLRPHALAQRVDLRA